MKVRNLTSHAIQFMFDKTNNAAQPEFDFVHIPPDMGKGYVVIDDEIWNKISEQEVRVQKFKEEEETISGVQLDNKPIVRTIQVPTGEFHQINVVKNLIRQKRLEIVVAEEDTRAESELKMIDELNELGFSVDASIDSGKLAKLHARIFPNEKPVLTPQK